MPFDFTGVYKLSDANKNYVDASQIAMAPRKVKIKAPNGETREEWQFLTANEVNLGHTIVGDVTKDEENVIEIQDTDRQGNDGEAVLWRFEPLTLKLWNEMGEKGEIGGWEELTEEMSTDSAVVHFYQHEWLQPCLSWWHKTPDNTDAAKTSEPSDSKDLKTTPK